MTAPVERRIDALDVPTAVLEASLRAGRLAEYGHWLHDADEDSTVPTFPDLSKGRRGLDASQRAGFELGIEWGEQPPNRRPAGYTSPDCEPAWAPKSVANVQTGSAL
ncbi:hypothetical protein OG900_33660 [Streptomyces sp. NBC_00433]